MGNRSDIDKAIRNIMNWADRHEWADELATVLDAHLARVCDHFGISREELSHELAEHGYGDILFGVMFEDFLSRRLPPDDRNIIDDYLKHRSWRESVPGRRYLQKLRDSVLSFYEVVAVSPGHHCDIRDLVRGGETIRVHEHMGTQNLFKWDRIAARVLYTNGKHVFSGGILPYSRDAAQSLLRVLEDFRKKLTKELPRLAGKEVADMMSSSKDLDKLFLQDAGPTFTSIWLMHTLERLHAPLPELVNRDGDALVFTETRFPVLAGKFEDIAGRLDTAPGPGWERDDPDGFTWTWLTTPAGRGKKAITGLAIMSFQDGQRPINGTLELKSDVLIFSTNSMERAERGRQMLEAHLHGLIGPALSKIQTPEQLMAEHNTRQQSDDIRKPAESIDPAIAAEIINRTLDQHYRQCLDMPIPALDNKTPRQCARSKKGREKVIEWMKHLENNELRRAANEGHKPYDSRWMWEELKLTRHRD